MHCFTTDAFQAGKTRMICRISLFWKLTVERPTLSTHQLNFNSQRGASEAFVRQGNRKNTTSVVPPYNNFNCLNGRTHN